MSRPPGSPIVRLAASVGSVTGVTLGTLGAYLAAMLLLGRALPREDFGYLSLWIQAVNLLGAASLLGFPNAILRHLPRAKLTASDWPRITPRLALLSTAMAAVGASLFLLVYRAPIRDGVLLFAAGACLGGALLPVTLLQIFGRYALGQALNTLWRPALLLGAVATYAWGRPGPSGLLAFVAAGALLQVAAAAWALRREPKGTQPVSLRALAPDAFAFAGLYVSAMLLFRLDTFFLPKLLDMDALGVYSAVGFVTLTGYSVVSVAVTQVLSPRLASREPVPLRALGWALFLGGTGVGAVLVLFANRLVPFAFGGKYEGDFRAIALGLAAAGTLQVLYSIPSGRIGILAGPRVLRGFLLLSMSSLAIAAILLAVLVPRHGLAGASSAIALTWAWRTGTAWLVARRAT